VSISDSQQPQIWAEELVAGEVYELGAYTLTSGQITGFAAEWDPLPLHVSQASAADSAFGTLIASGLQTLAVYQRLVVTTVISQWRIFAGRRLLEVKFLRPVRPGDMLIGGMRIDSVEFTHPDRALITSSGWLDIDGSRALELQTESYVSRRPADASE